MKNILLALLLLLVGVAIILWKIKSRTQITKHNKIIEAFNELDYSIEKLETIFLNGEPTEKETFDNQYKICVFYCNKIQTDFIKATIHMAINNYSTQAQLLLDYKNASKLYMDAMHDHYNITDEVKLMQHISEINQLNHSRNDKAQLLINFGKK